VDNSFKRTQLHYLTTHYKVKMVVLAALEVQGNCTFALIFPQFVVDWIWKPGRRHINGLQASHNDPIQAAMEASLVIYRVIKKSTWRLQYKSILNRFNHLPW